jgi:uncharacterized phage infection (PIP) family protein YhgE
MFITANILGQGMGRVGRPFEGRKREEERRQRRKDRAQAKKNQGQMMRYTICVRDGTREADLLSLVSMAKDGNVSEYVRKTISGYGPLTKEVTELNEKVAELVEINHHLRQDKNALLDEVARLRKLLDEHSIRWVV